MHVYTIQYSRWLYALSWFANFQHTHNERTRNHSHHSLGYICLSAPMYNAQTTESTLLPDRFYFVLFYNLETATMPLSRTLLLLHLPCGAEDGMEIEQPTSLLGHGCFRTFCELQPSAHDRYQGANFSKRARDWFVKRAQTRNCCG